MNVFVSLLLGMVNNWIRNSCVMRDLHAIWPNNIAIAYKMVLECR